MPAVRPPGGCGILSWFVPPALADEVAREAAAERDAVLAAAGQKVPRRRARLLPPRLAACFTLALCLLARLPCQDALSSLAGDSAAGLAVPAAARRRLGERPLELLSRRVAGVLLPSRDPWARVGGLLVTARDGTTLKAPATPGEHRRARPAPPWRREEGSRRREGREGAARGGALPAPAEHAQRQPPQPRLPPAPGAGPLTGDDAVRVTEFLITVACEDGATRTERYRAVTTLPGGRRYPAADLAAACARRRGIESACREARSCLAGGRVLRSRTPGLARQEAWALLITYQAGPFRDDYP